MWAVVLAAVLLATTATPCPDGCACGSLGGGEQEMTCGALVARLLPGRRLGLECGEAGALRGLPRGAGGDAPEVVVEDCAPPPDGWARALAALGAGNIRTLRLQRSHTAAPEHFVGLDKLEVLHMVDSTPPHLPAALFNSTPSLRRLTIQDAPLDLTAEMFQNVPHLDLLELPNVGLTRLEPGLLRHQSRLQRLSLWRNKLTLLERGALEGLTALETLELSSNSIQSFESGVLADTPNLKYLSAFANDFEELKQETFARLEHLEKVQIFNNKRALSLSDGALGGLGSLKALRLDRCGLRALPAGLLAGSAALRNLSLAWNRLQALPPDLLRDQTDLRSLDLSGNQIVSLDSGLFSSTTRLVEFKASHNSLATISRDTFSQLRALEVLVLSNNRLQLRDPLTGEYGPVSPLDALTRLRVLDLSRNRLDTLFADWRLVMLHLQSLDLSNNLLDTITGADLEFLAESVTVDLRHNNISMVLLKENEAQSKPTASLDVLLDDNPFLCDCRLLQLVRRLARPGPLRLSADAALCAAPPSLAGAPLPALPPAALSCALGPECPPGCDCDWRPAADPPLTLWCSAAPDSLATLPAAHTSLVLTELPATISALIIPNGVTELSLRGLGMKSIEGFASTHLHRLDLTGNNLTDIPKSLLQKDAPRLLVGDNPLTCDCKHADTLELLRVRADDWDNATCADGKTITRARRPELCAAQRRLEALALGAALMAAALSALAVVGWRWRREARAWLDARGLWPRPAEEDAALRPYDAFVSYSHLDEEWVLTELVPKLEGGPRPLRLCLHFRDWIPGEWIPAQIAQSVRRSRRTLLVVSEHFVGSVWAQLESRAALQAGGRIVVVLLGEIEDAARLEPGLRAYLASNTYVKWGDPWFWDKLLSALPRAPRAPRPAAPPAAARGSFKDALRGLAPPALSADKTKDGDIHIMRL